MNTVKCSLCFMMSNPLSFSHVVWARTTGVASGGRPSICFHILGWHFFLCDLPPASGWGMPKKLVKLLRLNTLNIGTLIGRSRKLFDTLKNHHINIDGKGP